MAMYPLGFRFHPSEEEMMKYLLQKVTQTLPCNVDNFIGTADLYGHNEPWDIFGGDSEDKERYFFTELKKVGKKKSGQRISRNVGDGGYWSNKGQKSPITNREGLVGYKRCFRYERKKDDNDRSGIWLLKEYVLADNVKRRVKEEFQDYALCVLKRKEKGKGSSGRKNDRQEDVVELEDFMESILNNNNTCSIVAPADHDPMVTIRDDDSLPIDYDWIMKVFDYNDRQEDMMLAVAPPDPMVTVTDDDSLPIDDDWIMKVLSFDDGQEDGESNDKMPSPVSCI